MSNEPEYTPAKVWTWNKANGGRFASINRPIAGPTHEKELPVGRHPLQLYSLGTPNGVKVTVMRRAVSDQGRQGLHRGPAAQPQVAGPVGRRPHRHRDPPDAL
jgi:GST-like protein